MTSLIEIRAPPPRFSTLPDSASRAEASVPPKMSSTYVNSRLPTVPVEWERSSRKVSIQVSPAGDDELMLDSLTSAHLQTGRAPDPG